MFKSAYNLILSLCLLAAAGCQSLPPGNPPEGPIVSIDNENDAINNEKKAIEIMVTALATSEPITNASPIAHVMMDKVNIQMEYLSQGSSLTSSVYRELIATGVADGFAEENSSASFMLNSSFIKLKTMENGDILFKWNMSLKKENSSDNLFSYSLKVQVKPIEQSTTHIDKEEIIPFYK